MFKGYVISLTVLWLMLVAVSAWILFLPSPKDFDDYQRLMEYSQATTSSLQMLHSTAENVRSASNNDQAQAFSQLAQQTRQGVSKQILYKSERHRLQSRLHSESSELLYGNKELGGELVEHFKNVECILQEKLVDDGIGTDASEATGIGEQYLRRIVAERAVYSYKTGLLEAYGVELAGYRLPGREWPISISSNPPLFQGKARNIEVLLFQDTSLKAKGFQGTFHRWGSGW